MRELAIKIIDLAAEISEVDDVGDIDAGGNGVSYYEVNKESILKIKNSMTIIDNESFIIGLHILIVALPSFVFGYYVSNNEHNKKLFSEPDTFSKKIFTTIGIFIYNILILVGCFFIITGLVAMGWITLIE